MPISRETVRIAARTLGRHRGFSAVAILSLALAIALNTTMCSMLDALLNPRVDMPYASRVYRVSFFGDFRHRLNAKTRNALLRTDTRDIEAFSGWWGGTRALVENGPTFAHGDVQIVAPNYFDLLGVKAQRGRLFTPADSASSTPPVVVSERLARKLFPNGAEPLGRRVDIQGVAHTIIGVLARESDYRCRRP